MNPEIFREYDIRGIADTDLTPPVVEALGRSFGDYLILRNRNVRAVAIGYDARISSPRLCNNLMRGLTAAGINVTVLGLCPTPALYFSLYQLNPGAGIMITGSHNPAEFNGFKLCVGTDTMYGEEIQKLRALLEQNTQKPMVPAKSMGTVSRSKILPAYREYLNNQFHCDGQSPLTVVLDAGNGTAGLAAPDIIRNMGCRVIELFSEPDGRFPHHHPDPTVPGNLSALIDTVKKYKADIGIAFDGDSDRIGVVDETGSILWGDQLMVIFSRDILKTRPGSLFVSEVKCSQTMYDDIRNHGGTAVMWKTGHSLIKAKMKELQAALAGEMSGHLFFADRYFGYDDAIYAACRLVEILQQTRKGQASDGSLHTLIADIPKTYATPEIRFDCPDNIKFHAVEKVKERFTNGFDLPLQPREVITVDGVRAVFENGWGLIRASNTQPILVMRFEANDMPSLTAIKTMMENQLQSILSRLQ